MQFIKRPTRISKITIPPVIVAVVDMALVIASFNLAFWLRYGQNIEARNYQPFLDTTPWLCLATILIFGGLGLYEKHRNGFTTVLRSIFIGVIGIIVVTIAITFWLRGFAFPRSVLLIALLLQFVIISYWRLAYWHLEKKLHGQKDLLVIGYPDDYTETLLHKVMEMPKGWFRIVGILSPNDIHKMDIWFDKINAVLLVSSLSKEDKAWIMRACQDAGREVFIVPDFYDMLLLGAKTAQIDDLPVLEVQHMGMALPQRFLKRTFDICAAVLILVILLPVLMLCGIMIKATSQGPVFYVQHRVGRNGSIFKLYKFRTMIDGAEKHTGPVLAAENDARITRVGKILRYTRLDELPQLLNILKGEMSLVGPRPERPLFVSHFNQKYTDYHYRHLVKPGLTGLAQVLGKYTTSPRDKLYYDIYYIRNFSLFLDMKILLRTIPVALSGESAAGEKAIPKDKLQLINRIINNAGEVAVGGEYSGKPGHGKK